MDCSSDRKKLIGNGPGHVQYSMTMMNGDGRRLSLDLDLSKAESLKGAPDGSSASESCLASDLTASDIESISSGGTSRAQDCAAHSPLSTSPASRTTVPVPVPVPTKVTQLKCYNSDGQVLSPRTMASPVRGDARPASPSKLWAFVSSSPSKGISSPARVRSAVTSSINSNSSNTPSILSFSADIRRGKIGEDRIFYAHTLRLRYNRYMQWRLVNARADAAFMVQKLNAERHLWNAWVMISELRHSIILKRIKLLLLRQKLKLTSILKGQMPYLEEWALLDGDHSSSLLGAIEALRANTLRLPVVEKAIANVPNLKAAVGSAVDVMQAMSSTIHTLSSKVEETNSLVVELVKLTAKERFLLEQCKDFLSSLAALQVKNCCLRTQILQFCHVLPAARQHV